MSENYGRASRELVKDTNAGKVHQPPGTISSRVDRLGLKSVRTGRQNVVVDGGSDGKDAVVQGLISMADKLVDRSLQERAAENYIKGANMVGTEQGRRSIEEMNSSWGTKLFGPNATLRGAQDTILKTHTDQRANDMRAYIAEDGFKLDDDEYDEYTRTQLEEALEPYEDPEIREKITDRYIQQLALTSRDRKIKHDIYLQKVNMDAVEKDVAQTLANVNQLVSMGTEDDLADATTMVAELFINETDMEDAAHSNMLGRTIIDQLDSGNSFLYEQAKAAGVFSKIDEDVMPEVASAYKQYQDNQGQKEGTSYARLERDVLDPDYDLEQLDASLTTHIELYGATERTQKIYEQGQAARVARNLKQDYEDKVDYQLAIQPYSQAFRRQPPEARSASVSRSLSNIANEEHELYLKRSGIPREDITEDNKRPTPQEKVGYLFHTTKKWASTWADGRTPVKEVAMMGKHYDAVIRNSEQFPVQAVGALREQTKWMKHLQQQDTQLFSDQFGPDMAPRMMEIDEIVNQGGKSDQLVHAELQEYHLANRNLKAGIKVEPDPERVTELSDALASDLQGMFEVDMLPRAQDALRQEVHKFSTLYPGEDGERTVRHRAIQSIKQRTTKVGDRHILDGRLLDEAMPAGTKFEDILVGLDAADEDIRNQELSVYGLDTNTRFVDFVDAQVLRGGAGGAVMTYRTLKGLVHINIPIPASAKQILPNSTERWQTTFEESKVEAAEPGTYQYPKGQKNPLSNLLN